MKKILFVNPFGLGDIIFTLYAVAAVKKTYPQAQVDFLCNERTIALVRMNPDIAHAYEFNRDRLRAVRSNSFLAFLGEYRSLIADWKRKKYEAMFDLSLGREFAFLGMLAGIPRRYGFDHKGRGIFLTHKLPFAGYEGKPVTETQFDLLRRAGISVYSPSELHWKIPQADEQKAEALLKNDSVGPWMALAPGGGETWGTNALFKQWDAEKFVVAANHWARSEGGILLLGSASEKALLERLRDALRVPCVVSCGEPLSVVGALLRRSKLFLGNDGGLLHFAHSLGVKSVSVFGPVDEKAYGPYGSGASSEVVTAEVPCRPCYKNFNFPPCPYDRRCLTEISVQKVLESVDKIA